MPSDPITVTELNRHVRGILERALPLTTVVGEISNLSRAASGHFYFTLKDETAQVRCVMFRSRAQLLPWRLENGQEVEAQALITLYEARGDFQLNVEMLRRSGLGRLFEAFARLRDKLAARGLFDATRKRALPRFPRRIGVVTSSQAAALRDVVAALARRAPHVPVIIYATQVQGEGAAAQIVQALASANDQAECDVLILTRGGGSIEDLWSFNEEAVAEAIAASRIPVVCGVGHETDQTIADFVADQRAATPTAAAELTSAGWFAAAGEIRALTERMRASMRSALEQRMQRTDLLGHRLLHPGERVSRHGLHLAQLHTRLARALHIRIGEEDKRLSRLRLRLAQARPGTAPRQTRLALAARRLQAGATRAMANGNLRLGHLTASLAALNPEATLARGYSIVRDAAGRVITDSTSLHDGDRINMRFAKGAAEGRIERVDGSGSL